MRKQDQLQTMPVTDYVAATSVGVIDGVPMLDLAYEEDSRADVDMNVVQTGDGRFIEVQGTAEGAPFDRAGLDALLALAEGGIRELVDLQRAIVGRFSGADVRRLLLATTNPDKISEIRGMLAGLPVELVGLDDVPPVEAPEETGTTFEENARLKARYYADASGLAAIAEDSGLEIDALGGAPGVESARFGGADTTYPEKFAPHLRPAPPARREQPAPHASSARRRRQLVRNPLRSARDGRRPHRAIPSWLHGFGYDPIFFYPPFGHTLAEVSRDQKATVSHRGAAFAKVREYLHRNSQLPTVQLPILPTSQLPRLTAHGAWPTAHGPRHMAHGTPTAYRPRPSAHGPRPTAPSKAESPKPESVPPLIAFLYTSCCGRRRRKCDSLRGDRG